MKKISQLDGGYHPLNEAQPMEQNFVGKNRGEILQEIAEELEYFMYAGSWMFAVVEINGHKQALCVLSEDFLKWLRKRFREVAAERYRETGEILRVPQNIGWLAGRLRFRPKQAPPNFSQDCKPSDLPAPLPRRCPERCVLYGCK